MMSLFRVPLNVMVALVLQSVGEMPSESVFSLCVMLLVIATLAQQRLFGVHSSNASADVREKVGLMTGEDVDEELAAKEDPSA